MVSNALRNLCYCANARARAEFSKCQEKCTIWWAANIFCKESNLFIWFQLCRMIFVFQPLALALIWFLLPHTSRKSHKLWFEERLFVNIKSRLSIFLAGYWFRADSRTIFLVCNRLKSLTFLYESCNFFVICKGRKLYRLSFYSIFHIRQFLVKSTL